MHQKDSFVVKKTKDDQGEIFYLEKNGRSCGCPFQPPLPQIVKNPLLGNDRGQVIHVNSPCASTCQHFTITNTTIQEEKAAFTIDLTCGTLKTVTAVIEEIQPPSTLETVK